MVIFSNYVINVMVVSWLLAQALKTLLTLIATGRLVLERLVGSGGMPSSHSALVCSVTVAIARKLGFSSPEFGLSLALAGIVMYDAMGVRRAAGEQAKVLNKIIFEWPPFFGFSDKTQQRPNSDDAAESIPQPEPLPVKELKESLGHMPFEVLGGCVLGIVVAFLMPLV